MEQQTDEWRQWRHKGIGASDVPIIMGVSPYKKAYALFLEKIQPEPPVNVENYAMAKGNRLEPIARAKMELILGCELKPALVNNEFYPWMLLSSDGLNYEKKIYVEVKYCGANFLKEVPEKYIPQVQFQHFLMGEGWTHYYVQINDDEKVDYFQTYIDMDYCKGMMTKVGEFRLMVENKEWAIAEDLAEDLRKYSTFKEAYDLMEVQLKELKSRIFSSTGAKFNYDKWSVITVNKKGSIDYEKLVKELLPTLTEEKLETYRKGGSSHKEIRIKKEKVAGTVEDVVQ